jgi:hypothetical protein
MTGYKVPDLMRRIADEPRHFIGSPHRAGTEASNATLSMAGTGSIRTEAGK